MSASPVNHRRSCYSAIHYPRHQASLNAKRSYRELKFYVVHYDNIIHHVGLTFDVDFGKLGRRDIVIKSTEL